MATHVVQTGECLSSIAARYGVADPTTLWQDPGNAALRQRRSDPSVLAPGDELVVPDPPQRTHTVSPGGQHSFRAVAPPVRVRLVMQDAQGRPLRGARYELRVDGEVIEGRSGGDGAVEAAVSPDARRGVLRVWQTEAGRELAHELDLDIGGLDPIDSPTGLRGRLNNLGLHCDPGGEDDDHELRGAVAAFQSRCGLEPTGVVDDATRGRLSARHDTESAR